MPVRVEIATTIRHWLMQLLNVQIIWSFSRSLALSFSLFLAICALWVWVCPIPNEQWKVSFHRICNAKKEISVFGMILIISHRLIYKHTIHTQISSIIFKKKKNYAKLIKWTNVWAISQCVHRQWTKGGKNYEEDEYKMYAKWQLSIYLILIISRCVCECRCCDFLQYIARSNWTGHKRTTLYAAASEVINEWMNERMNGMELKHKQ